MKRITALLLCLALALSLTACGKSENKSEPASDPADASAAGSIGDESIWEEEIEVDVPEGYELRAAFDQDNAPYSYLDESGTLVGLNVDVAKEICQRKGWKLNASAVSWEEKDQLLTDGEVDCVWGSASYSEALAEDNGHPWSIHSEIYVDAVVREDSGMAILDDLKGKTIEAEPGALFAVEGDSATELGQQLMKNAAAVNKVESAETAYEDLYNGKCDAVLVSGTGDRQVDFDAFDDIGFQTLYDVDIYSDESDDVVSANGICDIVNGASFPDDAPLYSAVEQTLEDMLSDGGMAEIWKDWQNRENGKYEEVLSRALLYQPDAYGDEYEGEMELDWDELEDMSVLDLEDAEAEEAQAEADPEPEVEAEEDESVLVLE